jgi:hypothetical protein
VIGGFLAPDGKLGSKPDRRMLHLEWDYGKLELNLVAMAARIDFNPVEIRNWACWLSERIGQHQEARRAPRAPRQGNFYAEK